MESPYGAEHGWYFYNLDKFTFARPFLRNIQDEKFKGLLLHSKLYSCTKDGKGWVYSGGHNISNSAWGNLNDQENTISINNFEIGVLFVSDGKQAKDSSNNNNNNNLNNNSTYPNLRLNKLFFPFPIDPLQYEDEDTPWVSQKLFTKKMRKFREILMLNF